MSNLHDYLDGLLDSGAESFQREVLEKIKAMADKPQVVKEYVPYPYWQWPPYQWQTVTTPAPKQWITVGGTSGPTSTTVDKTVPITSGTVYLKPNQFPGVWTYNYAKHDS